jgi:TolB protein
MKTKDITLFLFATGLAVTGAIALWGQADIGGRIVAGQKPVIAVTDMRGSGEAQQYMDAFNKALWDELDNTGQITLAPKTSYPLTVPQQPGDFQPPALFSSWTQPPVGANYLAFGYTAVQGDQILLYGYFFNLGQSTVQSAQLLGNRYYGSLNNDGAKKVAREFAADILKQLGIASLSGTKIYFVSDRTGNKEIWSMDYDGSNQRQLTRYRSISGEPAVSADGKLVAFMTYAGGNPQIRIHTTDTSRRQTFVNPVTSAVGTPEFTPDGKNILFSATVGGWMQLMMASSDGGGIPRPAAICCSFPGGPDASSSGA